jgi:Transglycosylase SLT domain
LIAWRCGCFGLVVGLLLNCPAHAQQADKAPGTGDPVCEQAGRQAEQAHNLPAGVLLAIGRVETGRWDPARGRLVPWPWAIDANGDGALLESKEEAVARTAVLRARGTPNVDVGCFQIDLTSHPDAFATLDQAFDPFTNADYAGKFLARLFARTGTWDDAVAAYHSMQPERGAAYRQRVFSDWLQKNDLAVPALPHPAPGPLVVQFASGARMQVWTPGNAMPVPDVTYMQPGAPVLPHVIVGRPVLR